MPTRSMGSTYYNVPAAISDGDIHFLIFDQIATEASGAFTRADNFTIPSKIVEKIFGMSDSHSRTSRRWILPSE